jgi:hypothetical protein
LDLGALTQESFIKEKGTFKTTIVMDIIFIRTGNPKIIRLIKFISVLVVILITGWVNTMMLDCKNGVWIGPFKKIEYARDYGVLKFEQNINECECIKTNTNA